MWSRDRAPRGASTSLLSGPRIKGIAKPVAEEIEAEQREREHERRKHELIRIEIHHLGAVRREETQARQRLLRPQPEEAQEGLGHHDLRDRERRVDDDRTKRVREQMSEENGSVPCADGPVRL